MEVNREQLAAALAKCRITIEDPEVSASVRGGPDGWQPLWAKGAPRDPAELADALCMLLEIEAERPDDDVVDAHICCEHADAGSVRHIIDTADPELTAMAKVIAAMDPLDHRTRQRIRMWVDERWATRG